MTPAEFRQDAAHAWDTRDRAAFERALRSLTDPDWAGLTTDRLKQHRSVLQGQLSACEEHLQRRQRTET